MRLMFDVVHPAHVHFFKNMASELEKRGHTILFVGRERDVVSDLLGQLEFATVLIGKQHKSRIGQAIELVHRTISLWCLARRFRADVICTRNPAGVIAARLRPRTSGYFDTDDGPAAGLHFRLAAPFSTVITAPEPVARRISSKKVQSYRGFKASAYLHPDRFAPDPAVLSFLGSRGRYAVVRFVSMVAAHDRGEWGLSESRRREIVNWLERRMPVFVSHEARPATANQGKGIPAERFLDALGLATLYVGDSQSVAVEACLMGTPALHISSWSGRLDALTPLIENGILRSYRPDQGINLENELEALIQASFEPQLRSRTIEWLRSSTDDVTDWYVDLLTNSK